MSSECVFCRIVRGDIPCFKVYEDQSVLAFLDIGPVSDGHTLVIPKQHFARLHQCPAELCAELTSCAARIAEAAVDAVDAEGYNVLCNNGRASGQLVEHLHLHVIPRHSGDNVFSRWPSYEYKPGFADKIAAKIRKKL
jgi:histidine triad (HIT) family protein